MKVAKRDVFAVEIGDKVYHLECVPRDVRFIVDDLVMQDDRDDDFLYFCDACGQEIR